MPASRAGAPPAPARARRRWRPARRAIASPSASRRPRELGRVERPGERRAAEQAAAEARALLVGEVDQDEVARAAPPRTPPMRAARRAPPSRRARRRASRRREPSRGGSRPPSAGRARGRRPGGAPRGCRPRRSRARRRSRRAARARNSRAARHSVAPADRAARPSGPPVQRVELAQVGDHPRRRRSPARRRRSSHALPAQRLGEAVGAAAAEREHLEVGVEDLEAERAQLLVEAARSAASRSPGRRRARSR